MSTPVKITCNGADITEHVAAMYDAIVGSLDWGSGFLDVETMESVLIVAHLAGYTIPTIQTFAAWIAQVKAKADAMRADSESDP